MRFYEKSERLRDCGKKISVTIIYLCIIKSNDAEMKTCGNIGKSQNAEQW